MSLHRLRRIPAHPADRWRPARGAARRSEVASWLTDPGSLTQRLRAGSRRFELRLLRQGWARAQRDEYALLGLPRGRKVWRRDVLLLADGQPRVLGHSVCRPGDLRGAWRLLRHLGTRPVGDAVFTRAQTRRTALRVRVLRPGLQPAARRLLALVDARHGAAAGAAAGDPQAGGSAALPGGAAAGVGAQQGSASRAGRAPAGAQPAAAARAHPQSAAALFWARRSAFVYRGRALWVTEVFFPPLP